MSEELRMDAYFYGFLKTGVPEIDLILSAVACAGKAFHHTDQWTDHCLPYHGHSGSTPIDWIQNAANRAAAAWNRRTPPAELAAMEMDAFYLQDSRGYVGNDMLFWAKDGKGYTTDLSNAHVYTKDEAYRQHAIRETDIPWPKEYIDSKARPAVDRQYLKRSEADAAMAAMKGGNDER